MVCFGILGINLSTVSAQFDTPLQRPTADSPATVAPSAQRRRKRRGNGVGASQSSERAGDDNIAASYARYSSKGQREEGIPHQHRKNRERAESNGHRIPAELEFQDEAVSGQKRKRDGLDAMLKAAEEGRFKVLYLYSLSRLARDHVMTMQTLQWLVYGLDVRVVSLNEGIDTSRDRWELIAAIFSILHEQYVRELAENVRRGQEGALLDGFSVGDWRFGYSSEPVEGSESNRTGRNAKPRKVYAIDETTAPWVIRIFHWYVVERRSLNWIARELNRLVAPKDHRSTTKYWTHELVVSVLRCLKYIGIWPWGERENVRDPRTSKLQQKWRPEHECEKWTRHFEYLRLISDEIWNKAQELLDNNAEQYAESRREDGTFNGSKAGAAAGHPRHLLSLLIECGDCAEKFYVGGKNGMYLFCPGYRRGTCSCQTQLRRDLAETLILDAIGQRILADPAWVDAVYEECVAVWREQEAHLPSELAAAEKALAEVTRKVDNLLDAKEEGQNVPELKQRLAKRREERRDLQDQVNRLTRADKASKPKPSREWVEERLQELGQSFSDADPAAAIALRNLVGGRIVVEEVRQAGKKRYFLRGRFTIRARAVASQLLSNESSATEVDSVSEEIVIDFVKPSRLDELAPKAKELYDQGILERDIAEELGIARSYLTKVLDHAFAQAGEERPDGRKRRHEVQRESPDTYHYRRIADEVKRLVDEELLLQEIAEELEVDRNTVTAALRYWYESRGLEAPDGRTRRKGLHRKLSRRDAKRTESDGGNSQSDPEAA